VYRNGERVPALVTTKEENVKVAVTKPDAAA
jgi:hypothetical protein